MKTIIDQLIIFILSLTLYVSNENSIFIIISVLVAIIVTGFLSYFENEKMTITVFFIYLITCFFLPDFLFFIPLIAYNVTYITQKLFWIFAFLPLIAYPGDELLFARLLIATFIITAHLLKHRTTSLQKMKHKYHQLRDNTTEISLQLEKQNKELLARQDYKINLATLTERNRIARDIHDNVGHMLSRSILQTAALLTIEKDEETRKNLRLLKNTLSEAMDSIRTSVHNLHEKSLNLEMEIDKLIKNFHFCPIKLDLEMKSAPMKTLKYCFIAVIKEALSNIIKHSNATQVSLLIREHPGFYQLVIHDNGTEIKDSSENGIGLKNIYDRITAVNGNINISTDHGFRIFISIPKKMNEGIE